MRLTELALEIRDHRSDRRLAADETRVIELPEARHFVGWGVAPLGDWEAWIPLDRVRKSVPIALSDDGKSVVIACGAAIVGLDLAAGKVANVSRAPALEFFEMRPCADDTVLAVFDVAVMEVSLTGQTRWEDPTPDMIVDWTWTPAGVDVVLEDRSSIAYDVAERRRMLPIDDLHVRSGRCDRPG